VKRAAIDEKKDPNGPLTQAGALQSMSRKGDCWDNAVAASFFSTLEFEGPSTATWRYVSAGALEIFTFIERSYNQTRLHSHNRRVTLFTNVGQTHPWWCYCPGPREGRRS
jgi:transposase InsO family protein